MARRRGPCAKDRSGRCCRVVGEDAGDLGDGAWGVFVDDDEGEIFAGEGDRHAVDLHNPMRPPPTLAPRRLAVLPSAAVRWISAVLGWLSANSVGVKVIATPSSRAMDRASRRRSSSGFMPRMPATRAELVPAL